MTAKRGGAHRAKPAPRDRSRVAFLDIGRAVSAIAVVYTHIDLVFFRAGHGTALPGFDLLDRYVFFPMRLNDLGPGGVGVAILFMISGFAVTPIALRLGGGRFAVNRFFRVYPMVAFAVLVSAVAVVLGLRPLMTGTIDSVDLPTLVANLGLYNFLQKPISAYVGVAWTMVVEVLFYLLLIALIPLLRKKMWLAILVELDLVLLVLLTHDRFGASYEAFASNCAYLLLPIAGQALWAAWAKRIPAWACAGVLLVSWGLFFGAARMAIDSDYVLRPYPVAIAIVVVALGVVAEPRLRSRKVWSVLSERTYSLYLLHGLVAFPVLASVYGKIPDLLAVLLALVATAAAVELVHRVVERPSHRLGRTLSQGGMPDFLSRSLAGSTARAGR